MPRALRFESLERRLLLSATSWKGGSGYWDTAANWSGGVVPNSASLDLTINSSSAATITIKAGESYTVGSLAVTGQAALANSGSLSVAGDSNGGLSIGIGAEVALPSVNTAVPTFNLLGNAGFETPTASGNATPPSSWIVSNSAYLSTQYAFAGSQSLQVSGPSSDVEQDFNVTAGKSYTASVYAMMPPSAPLTGSEIATLQFLYYDSSGNRLSSYAQPNQIVLFTSASAPGGLLTGGVGAQGWNFFYTTAVAPSKAATDKMSLTTYAISASYGGSVYFDSAAFGLAASPAKLTASSITNAGELLIGQSNTVNVSGNYGQTAAGKLDVQLGGTRLEYPYLNDSAAVNEQYGTLTIAGSANWGGTLEADLVNGYVPTTSDTFTPITYGSESGLFTSFNLPSGSGYLMQDAVTFTNIVISALLQRARSRRAWPRARGFSRPRISSASTRSIGTSI